MQEGQFIPAQTSQSPSSPSISPSSSQPQQAQMTYEQFQKQRFMRQEQMSVEAQQAIKSAGADSFSQKVMDTITSLRMVSEDLRSAQKQLEAQIFAQQRQLKQMEQNIDSVCDQLQSTFKPGSHNGSMLQ